MKNFTKTLVAATLALGAVSANASIIHDNTANAEAWLSVYDSTSANTFTLDLGAADGLTWGTLLPNKAATGTLSTVDLSTYADWNAFKSAANLATTKYAVAVGGAIAGRKGFMVTGASNDFFQGFGAPSINSANGSINDHALNINSDELLTPTPETSLVNDADGTFGVHGNSAGMWEGASYNVDTAYGQKADFNLVTLHTANRNTSATQEVFAAQFKIAGDTLTLSTVPVPAAVWMFGSALLGLAGVSRKRKAV